MNNKLLVSMLIFFIFSFGFLYAQESSIMIDSLNSFQNNEYINFNLNLNNTAFIQQIGNYNSAGITQTGNSCILPNIAEINQHGNSNYANSSQNGNSNLTLIGQYGSDNSAEINITGNRNLAGVLQYGNNNKVEQDLNGNDNLYLILQAGFGNSIKQIENQQNAVPMQIHQNGNGMRLTIINGGIN